MNSEILNIYFFRYCQVVREFPFEAIAVSIRRWRRNANFPEVGSLLEFCNLLRENEWAPRTNYSYGSMTIIPSATGLSALLCSQTFLPLFNNTTEIYIDISFPVPANLNLKKKPSLCAKTMDM